MTNIIDYEMYDSGNPDRPTFIIKTLCENFAESGIKVGSLFCQGCKYNNGFDKIDRWVDCGFKNSQ